MQNKNLVGVQALRGLAALLVVMFHSVIALQDYGWSVGRLASLGPFGQVGVDIFFVISGFVMMLATFNKPPTWSTTRAFLKARIARIVPLYWGLTAIMAATLLLAPSVFNKQHITPMRTVTSFLFLPYTEPGVAHTFPLVYVGWTLSYELYFYAVFSLLLLLPRRLLMSGVVVAFGGIVAISLLDPHAFWLRFLTDRILIEFVFGCAIAWAYVRRARLSQVSAILLIVGGTTLCLATVSTGITLSQRWFWWGVPVSLLVAGIVFIESGRGSLRMGILPAIGNSSYSLYLSHTFTLPVLIRVIVKLDPSHAIPALPACAILVTGSALVGHAIYLCAERPIDRWVKRVRRRPGDPQALTPPGAKSYAASPKSASQ